MPGAFAECKLRMQSEALPVTDRKALLERLTAQGFTEGLVQWIGSNLAPDPHNRGCYTWAFDADGAADMYRHYCNTDSWDVLAAPPQGATVNVLRAALSDRWNPGMTQRLATVCAQAREAHAKVRCRDSMRLLAAACMGVLPPPRSAHTCAILPVAASRPVEGASCLQAPSLHGVTRSHLLEGAGHWVHFDQPMRLRKLMLESFVSVAQTAQTGG